VIAWVVALALGTVWAVLLARLPGDLGAIGLLLLGVGGVFGTLLGVLMATGLLVRVFRLLGNPTRAVSVSPDELAPDVAFGVSLAFFFPSLVAYLGA
jgi:hypothetical protein